MYETVEVARRLLYSLPHIVVTVEIEDIGDQIKSILVVLDFRVQARQVETICQIVLVDFTEVLIAPR